MLKVIVYLKWYELFAVQQFFVFLNWSLLPLCDMYLKLSSSQCLCQHHLKISCKSLDFPFNAILSCLRLTQVKEQNANAKWFNLHREHTRILSHGVAVQRTLKILFAFSCNNHPPLAPPPPHTHLQQSD